jgi:hypothetical protein
MSAPVASETRSPFSASNEIGACSGGRLSPESAFLSAPHVAVCDGLLTRIRPGCPAGRARDQNQSRARWLSDGVGMRRLYYHGGDGR